MCIRHESVNENRTDIVDVRHELVYGNRTEMWVSITRLYIMMGRILCLFGIGSVCKDGTEIVFVCHESVFEDGTDIVGVLHASVSKDETEIVGVHHETVKEDWKGILGVRLEQSPKHIKITIQNIQIFLIN